jgi:hypothetical protein
MKYRDKFPRDDITANQATIANKISVAMKCVVDFLVPLSRDA